MKNQEVRDAARSAGVRLWEVAEVFGVNDGNFSRKLRRELPPAEKARVLDIINQLAREKGGNADV